LQSFVVLFACKSVDIDTLFVCVNISHVQLLFLYELLVVMNPEEETVEWLCTVSISELRVNLLTNHTQLSI